MPSSIRTAFVILILGLLIGGPIGYSQYRQKQVRGFRVVKEGVLYRSGQLTLSGLKRVLKDYYIKTVVTLRDATRPGEVRPPDWEEEKFCRAEEINYVRITPERWWASDGSVPAEKGVRRFLSVMKDPDNYPVLIHCCAGIHRTGAYCAIYRMELEGWTNAQAIAEMKRCGYDNIDFEYDLLTYLEEYRPHRLGEAASAPSRVPSSEQARPMRHRVKRKAKKPSLHADGRR